MEVKSNGIESEATFIPIVFVPISQNRYIIYMQHALEWLSEYKYLN